jgi:hypothetical protein
VKRFFVTLNLANVINVILKCQNNIEAKIRYRFSPNIEKNYLKIQKKNRVSSFIFKKKGKGWGIKVLACGFYVEG